jgi:hypothetical protein
LPASRPTNTTYTHYLLQQSIAFRDTAHIWQENRTYEIPRTTLKIPQPPFLRMAEQTGHTIIDTHCVFGHFWTDQDQRSQGLRFCFFLLFVVFTGLSATTPTMGMEGVLVFCSLFCSNLLNLISLRSLFCVFTSATNLCYLPYCLSL